MTYVTIGGGMRRADIQRFTEGDCHILAQRIHRITGWPVYAFSYDKRPDLHVFVRRPDGKVLDVLGVCSLAEMKRQWKCKSVMQFDPKEVRKDFLGPMFGHYSYKRARVIADRLLEQYGEGK